MTGKPLARANTERLHELQVILGRDDRDVAHVCGEQRQLGLNVGPTAIPSQQCFERECMAKIMYSGRRPASVRNFSLRRRGRSAFVRPVPV